MRASWRTSRFWSSRSWNNSGIAADFSCWTSSASAIDQGGGIGLARCVDLAGDAAQRGFHRRPVGFLRGGKLEPFLDAGDLHVAEQRVGFLNRRLRLGDDLRLLRRCGADICGGTMSDGGGRCIGLAQRLAQRRLLRRRPSEASANLPATASLSCLLALLETGFWGIDAAAISTPAPGHAIAAQNAGSGGADHEETGQRNDRRYPRQAALRFPRATPITFTKTGN